MKAFSISYFTIGWIIGQYTVTAFESDEECSIFLAESGIPNAGFGVYTTRSHDEGSVVSSDLTIHLPDVLRHLGPNAEFIRWTHDDYVWLGDFDTEYVHAEDVDINSFPLGALTNYHTYLTNVYPTRSAYDDSFHSRDKDPGVGAYSYSTRLFTAVRYINAGEELFTNYGEKWLDDHGMNDVPRFAHFKRAGRILQELSTAGLNKEDSIMTPVYMETLTNVISHFDPLTSSLLPKTKEELKDATVDKIALKTVTKRSLDWIKENGKCLDNIYPGRSTIEQAGNGAFAKRLIKKGELITPIPLLQIMNKTNFTMYASVTNAQGDKVRDRNEVVGYQLLLNYCFSHRDSSMLLCPSTYGAYINHDSSDPNAEYQWSSSWDPTTKEWLEMSYSQIEKIRSKGLSLDIIATRDIKPGEEIFFEYGMEWETAWNNHVQSYMPESKDEIASSTLMNTELHPIRTVAELLTNPYPSNIITMCYYYEDDLEKSGDDDSILESFLSDYDAEETLLQNFQEQKAQDPSITLTNFVDEYSTEFKDMKIDDSILIGKDRNYWPCKAYEETDDDEYTVRMYQSTNYEDTDWTEAKSYKFVTNYPREYMRFANRPYSSDVFLKNAFRHSIHIRDDLFPTAWRNLA